MDDIEKILEMYNNNELITVDSYTFQDYMYEKVDGFYHRVEQRWPFVTPPEPYTRENLYKNYSHGIHPDKFIEAMEEIKNQK